MTEFKIVADSCCEPTPDMIGNTETVSVPFSMTIEDKTYVDDESLDIQEFIREMKNSPETPKSACPTPFAFEEAVGESKQAFIITISKKLSGTYDSAVVAANNIMEKDPERKVHVFDSRSAVSGETLIYLKLNEFIDSGMPFEEIVIKMEDFIEGMTTLVLLESLDNLVKNGRMSKIAGTIASFLSIHPILFADDGEIDIYDKTIGMKKAVNQLIEDIGKICSNVKDKTLVITHCNNPERAKVVESKVKDNYQFKKIFVNQTRGLGTMYANDGGIVLAF